MMVHDLIYMSLTQFVTFPGAAAYTQSAAAYTQSAAAYTQGAAAYTQGTAAFMGKVRIKLTQSSWAGAFLFTIVFFCLVYVMDTC